MSGWFCTTAYPMIPPKREWNISWGCGSICACVCVFICMCEHRADDWMLYSSVGGGGAGESCWWGMLRSESDSRRGGLKYLAWDESLAEPVPCLAAACDYTCVYLNKEISRTPVSSALLYVPAAIFSHYRRASICSAASWQKKNKKKTFFCF